MVNVNQITSQLAKMPDAALQQYAAMHKGDPYTLALAVGESNRRKQMRAAMQAQPQGEAPKVVDQELAEMGAHPAPETVGIGALPAGDMRMADGGIVGYASGGKSQEQQDYEAITGFGRRVADFGGEAVDRGLSAAADVLTLPGRGVAGALESAVTRPLRAVGVPVPYLPDSFYGGDRSSATPYYDRVRAHYDGTQPAAPPAAQPTTQPAAQPKAPVMPTGAPPVAAPPGTSMRESVSASVRGSQPSGGIAAIQRPKDTLVADTAKLFDTAQASQQARDAQRLKDYRANRPEAENFAERKGILLEDQARISQMESSGSALPWLEAAAAMVQPGQSFLTSIVNGMTVGGKAAAAAKKELANAKREARMGMAQLGEAQRAAARGDADREQAYKDKAADHFDALHASRVAALSHATGTSVQMANDNWQKAMQEAAADRRTHAQIAASRIAATTAGRPFDMKASYAKYLDDFKPDALGKTAPMTLTQYQTLFGVPMEQPTVSDPKPRTFK